MDKYSPDQWQDAAIQSDVITNEGLRIFIPYDKSDDRIIDDAKESNFSDIIIISINDSVYSNLQWVGINKMNGQKGVQTVINTTHLESKMHLLKIEELNDNSPIIIPFWKQ